MTDVYLASQMVDVVGEPNRKNGNVVGVRVDWFWQDCLNVQFNMFLADRQRHLYVQMIQRSAWTKTIPDRSYFRF